MDFEPVTDSPGKTGFRLDIGMFDKRGRISGLDDMVGFGKAGIEIATSDEPANKNIAIA